MKNIEAKTIPFLGTNLIAARDDDDNQIWVGIRPICDGIGLNQSQIHSQAKKVKEDFVLSKGYSKVSLPTNGGYQMMSCLKLEFVPLWLAKILITPNMKKNQADVADRLLQYQLKVKDALADAFTSESNKNISPEMYLTILRAYVNTYEENVELKKTLEEMKQGQGSGYYMI